MSKNADKIVANAKGKIDPKELSNSGTSGFLSLSTGYPSNPIIEYLRNSEQLHYLMGNYTDGVTINEDTTSLSDDQRNYICVTDSRVLIIIGDNEKDETFEYKLKRIIGSEFASGMVSSDKLRFNLYNSKASEDNVVFPIREGSDGKAASKYISSNCKGMAPKTGKSQRDEIAKTNRSSEKTSQSTPSTTGQKNKNRQTSTKRNKTNGKEKEQKEKVEEKIDSIRSSLNKVDSLLTDAEYEQAKQQVDKIKSEISSLKTQVSQKNYDSLDTELQRLEKKCNNRLSKSYVLSQLRAMNPYEFEELIAKIWEKQGWDAEATSGSADRGVDVVAVKQDAFEKRRHLIQVKRHGKNSTVGSEDIQKYSGLYQRDEQVDDVFVVTSNQFTKEAREVAKKRGVSLLNVDELYDMLIGT